MKPASIGNQYLRISETRIEVRLPLKGFKDYTYRCLSISEYPDLTKKQLVAKARMIRDELISLYGLYETQNSDDDYISKLINGYMVALRVKPKKRITKMFTFKEHGDKALDEAREFRDMLVLFKAGFAEQAQRHTKKLKVKATKAAKHY